jgi:hypothetical protein
MVKIVAGIIKSTDNKYSDPPKSRNEQKKANKTEMKKVL